MVFLMLLVPPWVYTLDVDLRPQSVSMHTRRDAGYAPIFATPTRNVHWTDDATSNTYLVGFTAVRIDVVRLSIQIAATVTATVLLVFFFYTRSPDS